MRVISHKNQLRGTRYYFANKYLFSIQILVKKFCVIIYVMALFA